MGGLSALGVLSADVTDFQGLEMTFSSCTARPRVDSTKTTVPHPSELSTCKTCASVERRPISEAVLEGEKWDSIETFIYVNNLCRNETG